MARKKSTFCRSLGGRTIVSSQPSAGQSVLIDSIPVIGAETLHPCLTRPPDCFCSVSLTCTMFPANWIKAPHGAYSQICELPLEYASRGVGEQVSQVPSFCFKIAPIGGQVPTRNPGCRGYPGTPASRTCSDGPIQKRERRGCHSAKPNIAAGDPHARLCGSWLPRGEKHPDSCRRRAKLQTSSQGPFLSDLCDRPILVLSDVEILTCEYGAGLICVILG